MRSPSETLKVGNFCVIKGDKCQPADINEENNLLVGRAQEALRPKRCVCGWVPIYVCIYLSIHISMSRRRVPTSFPCLRSLV